MRPILPALLIALLAGQPLLAETPAVPPAMDGRGGADAGAYLAARVALADRDFRPALGWYRRALASDPANLALLDGAVVAAMGAGDFAAAADFATALTALGEKSQIATLAQIAAQARAGDYAALIAGPEAGREVSPLFDRLVVAWAKAGQGEMTGALADFDALAKGKGTELFGAYHQALALASVGDFEGADRLLARDDMRPLRSLRRGAVAHAQILSQLERNADALALLDAAFDPGSDPAIDLLRARLTAGESVPYDTVLTPQQGLAEVFFTLAVALNGEADDVYTLLYARAAVWLRPDHAEAALMAAGLLSSLNQFDLAAETYQAVPDSAPEFQLAELGRAESLLDSGRQEAAFEVMQALTRRAPDQLAVQTIYGDMLRRVEKYEDAVKAYDRAVTLLGTPAAKDWLLFYSRGMALERLGQWDRAEPDLRKSLELNPGQPQVLNYLGYSLLEMNRNLDEALSMIEQAAKARPDSGYIIDSLAWAYFRLGRYGDALAPMERASLLEPVDPVVTDHLGDVYWAVGRQLEAQFQWRRALSYGPEPKAADRIRQKLDIGLDAVLAAEGAPPLVPVKAAKNDP